MAKDLAIDVGIPTNSDEFETFVSCIENILEYGCGYGDDFTENVLEKCRNSDLDIAKQVIKELEKPRSRYRQEKLKWWQKYTTNQKPVQKRHLPQRRTIQKRHNRRPPQHRPMSPMFRRPPQNHRPMSPLFQGSNKRRKRNREEIEYERQPEAPRHRRYIIREDRNPTNVPDWHGKNKRYRTN